MAESGDDRDRQLVPRWRSFAATAALGELRPTNNVAGNSLSESLLADIREDWDREPGLSVAADFVSAAIAIGHPKSAEAAARFVLDHKNAPAAARELAERSLYGFSETANSLFFDLYSHPEFTDVSDKIRTSRARLIEYPYNPVLWTNLALLYTTLGQAHKAQRAIRVAINLAATNRFVVRSASRFYLHQGEADRAHEILLDCGSVSADPWLLASEISMASVRKRTSRLIKTARAIIESQNYPAFHISELSGALATLEARSGNLKKSRRLWDVALVDPAENAVAQAAWINRNIDRATEPSQAATVLSYEASAWSAEASGKWDSALTSTQLWLDDQPFSSRPAMLGSYVASTGLDDYHTAESIARRGLLANPDDASLYNNLVFSLVMQDKLADAKKELAAGESLPRNDRQKIVATATRGLVEFRSGNSERGRLLYQLAIGSAQATQLELVADVASIYLAMEEARSNVSQAHMRLKVAYEAAARLPSPLNDAFNTKIANAAKRFGGGELL